LFPIPNKITTYMNTDYIQLDWFQNGKNIIVKLPTATEIIEFPLEHDIINHLVANSPKVVHFHIKLEANEEKTYIVDFEHIKSIPSTESFLTKKVGKLEKKSAFPDMLTSLGQYCISRGESHFNKHISELGWQRQRKYFNLYSFQEVDFKSKLKAVEDQQKAKVEQAKKVEVTQQIEVQKPVEKKSKLKQCTNCGEVIPALPACPYCGTKQ